MLFVFVPVSSGSSVVVCDVFSKGRLSVNRVR